MMLRAKAEELVSTLRELYPYMMDNTTAYLLLNKAVQDGIITGPEARSCFDTIDAFVRRPDISARREELWAQLLEVKHSYRAAACFFDGSYREALYWIDIALENGLYSSVEAAANHMFVKAYGMGDYDFEEVP